MNVTIDGIFFPQKNGGFRKKPALIFVSQYPHLFYRIIFDICYEEHNQTCALEIVNNNV